MQPERQRLQINRGIPHHHADLPAGAARFQLAENPQRDRPRLADGILRREDFGAR
jgi:hypothetical protein